MRPERSVSGATARSLAVRALLFGVLWWVLVEGEVGHWLAAGVAVLAATGVSLLLVAPGSWRWSPGGMVRFLPYFLGESVRGGVDVARRALHPRLPIRPGFADYALRLPEGPAQVFLANAVSLLPGTLSAELRGGRLRVHLLDREMPAGERLEALEARVAALFSLDL